MVEKSTRGLTDWSGVDIVAELSRRRPRVQVPSTPLVSSWNRLRSRRLAALLWHERAASRGPFVERRRLWGILIFPAAAEHEVIVDFAVPQRRVSLGVAD